MIAMVENDTTMDTDGAYMQTAPTGSDGKPDRKTLGDKLLDYYLITMIGFATILVLGIVVLGIVAGVPFLISHPWWLPGFVAIIAISYLTGRIVSGVLQEVSEA